MEKAVMDKINMADSQGATNAANPTAKMSKKELEALLKHGAFDLFREEKEGKSEEASQQFVDADIEEILDRHTVHIKAEDNKAAQPNAMASFSTASFLSGEAEGADKVDIDDENF